MSVVTAPSSHKDNSTQIAPHLITYVRCYYTEHVVTKMERIIIIIQQILLSKENNYRLNDFIAIIRAVIAENASFIIDIIQSMMVMN